MRKYYSINYEATYLSNDGQYWFYQAKLHHVRMLTHKGLIRILNKKAKENNTTKIVSVNWLTHTVVYG
jgi:hypothetical protein